MGHNIHRNSAEQQRSAGGFSPSCSRTSAAPHMHHQSESQYHSATNNLNNNSYPHPHDPRQYCYTPPAEGERALPATAATTQPPLRFRHDPYNTVSSKTHERPMTIPEANALREKQEAAELMRQQQQQEQQQRAPEPLPLGTLHLTLWGKVSFVPYPAEEFHAPNEHRAPSVDRKSLERGETVRVFIGQLPYYVTDMQLNWLSHTFGYGHVVHYAERIMKRQANGDRLPTGCIHAFCRPEAVTPMIDGMHKRILVDDTGVWFAADTQQGYVLEEYVQMLKRDKTKRFPHRPYDTIVVQLATSSFVSKPQTAVGGLAAELLPPPRNNNGATPPHRNTPPLSPAMTLAAQVPTPRAMPRSPASSAGSMCEANFHSTNHHQQQQSHGLFPPM